MKVPSSGGTLRLWLRKLLVYEGTLPIIVVSFIYSCMLVFVELQIAQEELKKPCERCHNYEIQLCRFQEVHKVFYPTLH